MDIDKLLKIEDVEELYHIVDKYYRDNNKLHIRLKIEHHRDKFLIFYDQNYRIDKNFKNYIKCSYSRIIYRNICSFWMKIPMVLSFYEILNEK